MSIETLFLETLPYLKDLVLSVINAKWFSFSLEVTGFFLALIEIYTPKLVKTINQILEAINQFLWNIWCVVAFASFIAFLAYLLIKHSDAIDPQLIDTRWNTVAFGLAVAFFILGIFSTIQHVIGRGASLGGLGVVIGMTGLALEGWDKYGIFTTALIASSLIIVVLFLSNLEKNKSRQEYIREREERLRRARLQEQIANERKKENIQKHSERVQSSGKKKKPSSVLRKKAIKKSSLRKKFYKKRS